jgi:hypothetical protein
MSIDTTEPESDIDRGRIRKAALRVLEDKSRTHGELVTVLQAQFDVREKIIRDELQKCFDADLLYGESSDSAEVRVP